MKGWLKYTFLGFFSDKIVKGGASRSYGNVLLAFVMALVFTFLGLFAADMAPFSSLYARADDFKNTAYRVFSDGVTGVTVSVEKGKLSAVLNADPSAEGKLIDTVANPDDAAAYSVNGYRVVVDLRPADSTFDDFRAVCVKSDGTEISYETYLSLPSELKKQYTFTAVYTGEELQLTQEKAEGYEAYLEGKSDPNASGYDKDVASGYTDLKTKRDDMTAEEYYCGLYELYCKAYYPDLSAYEKDGGAPKIRNYYYYNYAESGKFGKFLFVFDDALVGAFPCNGTPYLFYGFYNNLNGVTLSGGKSAVDSFIVRSFNATSSFCAMNRFMTVMSFMPFIAIIFIALALLFFCLRKLLKTGAGLSFGESLKIVGAFVAYSSLISALITLILGFVAPGLSLTAYSLLAFAAVLALRSGIYLVREYIAANRARAEAAEGQNDKEIEL